MSYDYSDNLDAEAKMLYVAKLEAAELKECPYKLRADCWLDDPKKWPKVEWPDVYEYLINSPGL